VALGAIPINSVGGFFFFQKLGFDNKLFVIPDFLKQLFYLTLDIFF
jgi:hypothetical protein